MKNLSKIDSAYIINVPEYRDKAAGAEDSISCGSDETLPETEGERIDDIGFGGMKLIQKPKDFCYGIDAVLLADFTASRHKDKGRVKLAVDLGTGTGIIPFIIYHKMKPEKICGIEFQKDSWSRACRSAILNGLQERISFINDDVGNFASTASSVFFTSSAASAVYEASDGESGCGGDFPKLRNRCAGGWGEDFKGKTDIVISNPPYFESGGGLANDRTPKCLARHETSAGLRDFMACASYLLKPKGEFFMIHRPFRLADICCFGREAGLEPKEICFVSPKKNATPNLMLIQLVKGGGKELRFLDNICVYGDDGKYTPEVLKAYERAEAAERADAYE